MIIPVLPHLVEDYLGGNKSQAAHWVGIFGTVFAFMQFFSTPIQGALADRYGRRPVILLSCFGLGPSNGVRLTYRPAQHQAKAVRQGGTHSMRSRVSGTVRRADVRALTGR